MYHSVFKDDWRLVSKLHGSPRTSLCYLCVMNEFSMVKKILVNSLCCFWSLETIVLMMLWGCEIPTRSELYRNNTL